MSRRRPDLNQAAFLRFPPLIWKNCPFFLPRFPDGFVATASSEAVSLETTFVENQFRWKPFSLETCFIASSFVSSCNELHFESVGRPAHGGVR